MRKGIGRWCCLLLLVAGPVTALEQQTTQLMVLRDGIDQAVLQGDAVALAGYGEQLEGMDSDWAVYYLAYTRYRQSQLLDRLDKVAKDLLNECIDTLKGLVKRRPDLAEAYALQATCYGNSTRFYRLRAAVRGSAGNKALKQALKLSSDNPRVLLQYAQSLIFRPALLGRDKDKALEQLMLAAEVFVNWRSPDPESPVWGEAETWLVMARLHKEAGDNEQARLAFEKALSLAPSFRAAKDEFAALG